MVETLRRGEGEKLSKAVEKAMSMFQPEVKSRKVKITKTRGHHHLPRDGRILRIRSPNLTPEGRRRSRRSAVFCGTPCSRQHIRWRAHGQHPDPAGGALRASTHELGALVGPGDAGGPHPQRGLRHRGAEPPGDRLRGVPARRVERHRGGEAYNRRVEIIVMRKKEYS